MSTDLRPTFFSELGELAKKDRDIILLVGDLGYSFMEEYQKRYPFVNCGIAEQNMVGMAAGMAHAGKKPYVYSNSIFLAGRAFEQIRDDIAYMNLNVKLIGTGAAGFLGHTHNWEEGESARDLVGNLPNLAYTKPNGPEGLKSAMRLPGPLFIQL